MNEPPTDLSAVLVNIHRRAVAIAREGWVGLGDLVDAVLPEPLNPIALLPIATGVAAGGDSRSLVPAAAAIVLQDVALRIVDDCGDQDDPQALYRSIGIGRALNAALALNTAAARELTQTRLPPDRLEALQENYFRALMQVCEGQDRDMSGQADTLAAYQEIVALKTVAAYAFTAAAGAHIVTDDPNVIAQCALCGTHLGWMVQILNDIEALWFQASDKIEIERRTYPVLFGLSMAHPNTQYLVQCYDSPAADKQKFCALLDDMNVRPQLVSLALDHRDQALKALGGALHPGGRTILNHWLNWYLRDCARLLATIP